MTADLDLLIVAVHELGHAVEARQMRSTVERVTITVRDGAIDGHTIWFPSSPLAQITVSLAGVAAERLVLDAESQTASRDGDEAIALRAALEITAGDTAAATKLIALMQPVVEISLAPYVALIRNLADELVRTRILKGDAVAAAVDQARHGGAA